MLAAYDHARTQAKAHKVETYHGKVAEASFRRWLEEFLPKRYAVTSGYIVSRHLGESARLPHFDVIIYDQLESPVLWVERDPDNQARGMSRAIPAEHVRGVFEVKSAFNSSNAVAAMKHLAELDGLVRLGIKSDVNQSYLPPTFASGAVFFELRKQDANAAAALTALTSARSPGHFAGIILRGDSRAPEEAGLLRLLTSSEPRPSTFQKDRTTLLEDLALSWSHDRNDEYSGAMLIWAAASFALFAFNLVEMLAGNPFSFTDVHGMTYLASSREPGA